MSSAQRTALYWADLDRHYRGTRAECDAGRYICPRCRDEESVLRLVSYKRTEGKNHRLLSCPNCHFLIKPANIIGHPAYDAASEATMKSASQTVTVTTLTLHPPTPRDVWGDARVISRIERSLKYLNLPGVEFQHLSKVADGLEAFFDLQGVDSQDLASQVIRHLDRTLPEDVHFALFGSQSYMLIDYRVDDLGEEARYASHTAASYPKSEATVTLRPTTPKHVWGDVDLLKRLQRNLTNFFLKGVNFRGVAKVQTGLEISLGLDGSHLLGDLGARLLKHLHLSLSPEDHEAIFGGKPFHQLDYALDEQIEDWEEEEEEEVEEEDPWDTPLPRVLATLTLIPIRRDAWKSKEVLEQLRMFLTRVNPNGMKFVSVKATDGVEMTFDLLNHHQAKHLDRVVTYEMQMFLKDPAHRAIFGEGLLDSRVEILDDLPVSRTASTDTVVARVTVQTEEFTGLFREEVMEILEDYNNSPHEYLKHAVKTLPKTSLTRMNVEKIAYHRTGRRSGVIVLDIRVEDDPGILDRLEDDVLDALSLERTPFAVRYFVFGTSETQNGWHARVQLEVL